jgi:hypothetical protein
LSYNDVNILRDQQGMPIPQYFNSLTGQFEPLEGAEGASNIKSIQKKFRESFSGASLDSNKWVIVQTGTGMTVSQAAGELSIVSGTTINQETIIESIETFTVPFRAMFGLMLSQRVANQEFRIEMVSVDGNGVVDGQFAASWLFDATIATQGKYEVQSGGLARLASGASTIISTAAYSIKEIELFADEAWFHDRAMDSSAGRSSSYVRHQQIPDPNKLYKIRIRAKNLAVAPTTTTLKFQYCTVIDYSELTTEITASRGGAAAGMAMPVQVANTPAMTVSGNPAMQGVAAHDAVVSGNPVLIGAYAHDTGQAVVSAAGDVARLRTNLVGELATFIQPVGIQANAWNNIAVLAAGVSTAIDIRYNQKASIFGNVSAATNLTIQYSQDNVNWYDSETIINIAATGNFGRTIDIAARYIRLKSSAAVTITATIAGK